MKRNLPQEAIILLIAVLLVLKCFYQLRAIPMIGNYLSTYSAILLIYAPVLHLTLRGEGRRDPLLWFERSKADLMGSLRLFGLTVLLIFPPFLVFSHWYQKIFFNLSFSPASFEALGTVTLTQLFLVALPEEFFFRGYLQGLLAERFPKKISCLGLSLSQGALVTCLLFAFSHSIIALQWWHFSIFFPSLVFAWLREQRQTITASILFHAFSNLVIAWIGMSYQ